MDDAFLRTAMVAIGLLMLGIALHSLWTGRVRLAGETYARAAQPADYWRELVLALLPGAILLAALLVIPPASARDPFPPYGAMFLLAVISPGVLRAAWTGRVEFGSNRFGWRDRPGPYWTITLVGFALCAAAVALLIWDPRF